MTYRNRLRAKRRRQKRCGPKPAWACPHCGSQSGTWFDRCVSPPDYCMETCCNDCGRAVA